MDHEPKVPLANAVVLLIRHGEKPDVGPGLAPAGEARAEAYVDFFRNLSLGGPVRIGHLFAAADSHASARPSLTLAPLAEALGLAVDTSIADKDFEDLARLLRGDNRFANSGILICWHHEHILPLATALGVDAGRLPASSAWPGRWRDEVFGWMLRIGYDADGRVLPDRTACVNEHLTDDDQIDPPGPSPAD